MSEEQEMSMADKVAAATVNVKKDWVAKGVKHMGRFAISKNKRSQDDGAISNVMIITDVAANLRYTLSVNATVTSTIPVKDGEEEMSMEDIDMSALQKAITAFLKTVHEEL